MIYNTAYIEKIYPIIFKQIMTCNFRIIQKLGFLGPSGSSFLLIKKYKWEVHKNL